MTRTLEFIGMPGPWRDAAKWAGAVRAANPSLDDEQVERVLHRENARNRPRHPNGLFMLFGADILSSDLASMDTWNDLEPVWQRELPMYPIDGGIWIKPDDDDAPMKLQLAIAQHGAARVNRRSLMVPYGLSKTYVWRVSNGWVQQVADADVAIIRATPVVKYLFRDPNLASGDLQVQRYERQGTGEVYQFSSIEDAKRFEKSLVSTPQWKGF